MKSSKPTIEHRHLERLHPRPENEKQHTESQIGHLMSSIREFGFIDPIGIAKDGTIIEGHGRYEAAKRLHLETVPCLVIDHLSAVEVQAYGIAHNQTNLLTGLDTDAVINEFARLEVADQDYLALGFSADEVTFMSPEQRDILEDDSLTSTVADHSEWKDLVQPAIRTHLAFDDAIQQARFEQLIGILRDRYPMEPTLGDRLIRFVDEYGGGL